jgi:MFS family permease
VLKRIFPPPAIRWNYWLLVAHGIVWTVAMQLIHAAAVVPLVLSHYGATPLVIGLVVALVPLGSTAPVIPMAATISHKTHRKPWLIWPAFAGRLALFIPALAMIFAPGAGTYVILLYALGYGLYWVSDGIVAVPYTELVGKMLPPGWRGRMFATFQVMGGVTAAVVSIVLVTKAFAAEEFDLAQGGLLSLCAVLLLVGLVAFWKLRESPGLVHKELTTLGIIRSIPERLRRQPQFARIVLAQILLMSYPMTYSFVLLGAEAHLGVGAGVVASFAGLFLVAERMGVVCAAWGWGYLNDHRGSRTVIRGTGRVIFIAMTLPLLFHLLVAPQTTSSLPFSPLFLYGTVFFLVGASIEPMWVATSMFLLDLVPESQRAVYLAVRLTLYSVALFWPVIGGWLAQTFGYPTVYCTTLVTVGTGLWLTRGLIEPRNMTASPAAPKPKLLPLPASTAG